MENFPIIYPLKRARRDRCALFCVEVLWWMEMKIINLNYVIISIIIIETNFNTIIKGEILCQK